MAKTIMVSNNAYDELKKLKGEDKSFSDVIVDLVIKNKAKLGADLWKHFGVFKGDKEYEKVIKDLKKGWAKWQERYA